MVIRGVMPSTSVIVPGSVGSSSLEFAPPFTPVPPHPPPLSLRAAGSSTQQRRRLRRAVGVPAQVCQPHLARPRAHGHAGGAAEGRGAMPSNAGDNRDARDGWTWEQLGGAEEGEGRQSKDMMNLDELRDTGVGFSWMGVEKKSPRA